MRAARGPRSGMQTEVHRDGIEALLPEWEQLFALR